MIKKKKDKLQLQKKKKREQGLNYKGKTKKASHSGIIEWKNQLDLFQRPVTVNSDRKQ